MTRKYFGTDGVRGTVGQGVITPEFAMRLGFAAGRVLTESQGKGEPRPVVVIGKDTRISGYMMESAMEAGFIAAGVDVALAGPIPTPAVAHLARAMRLSAGVVISASHNPYYDNGIKFFAGNGRKLDDALELAIEKQLDSPMQCVKSAELGKASRINDAAARYIEFCKSTFPAEGNLRGKKIVIDCAHGACYLVAPKVFRELGAEVIAVANEPDGSNINNGVGATHGEFIQTQVIKHQADFGIAFDGDGDRLLFADAQGTLYDGDKLLYILALAFQKTAPLAGVVGTLMSNLGFEHALARHNLRLERSKVGDRYVLERMLQLGWPLGGENSGHILYLDKHTTGDGLIAALQVFSALSTLQQTMAEVCADLRFYHQKMINVRINKGFDWAGDEAFIRAQKRIEDKLAEKGRVLIRPSGTEPVLRIMVEAEDAAMADAMAGDLADTVRRTID